MNINALKAYAIPAPQMEIKPIGKEVQGLPGSKSFASEFTDAMKQADKMQVDADRQIEDLAMKNGGTTPHEAMIALEKADIAFQLMTSIKAKIIRAYEEVLRTQV